MSAIFISANSDKIIIGQDSVLNRTKPWAITFWYKLTNRGTNSFIMAWGVYGASPSYCVRYFASTGRLLFYMRDASGNYVYRYTAAIPDNDDWHQFVGTVSSGGVALCYIDGVETNAGGSSNASLGAIEVSGDLYLGCQSGGGSHMSGSLAEWAISNSVPDSGTIANLQTMKVSDTDFNSAVYLPLYTNELASVGSVSVTDGCGGFSAADHPVPYGNSAYYRRQIQAAHCMIAI